MNKNYNRVVNTFKFSLTFLSMGLLFINPTPHALAHTQVIKVDDSDNQAPDESEDDGSVSTSNIPFNNSVIVPKLSKVKQNGYVIHDITIYKKPDLDNVFFQTTLRVKLGEEASVYTTELNKMITSKEEKLNLNQDGQGNYSNNSFNLNKKPYYKNELLKTHFKFARFYKLQSNDDSSQSFIFNGNANVLSNMNVEQEKTAYQITVFTEREDNNQKSNLHSVFNIASISAIDKKAQSANSNSKAQNENKGESDIPNSNLVPNSTEEDHNVNPKKSENKENKNSHTTFDVKKSPTVTMYQRSYETFSLNKKMTIFSTDDFLIHDTTTLN